MKTNSVGKRKDQPSVPFPAPHESARARRSKGSRPAPVSAAEVKEWVQKAKDLPDIRWDKVQAMREAIRSEGFDQDERLAQLADKLPSELIEYFRQLGNESADE